MNSYISSLNVGPDTSKTITGATHGFATTALLVGIYDNASPRNAITAAVAVNASNYDVVITFASPQSNYYVVINGGIGPAGPGSATRSGCFDFGQDNAASDLVDADIGPQGNIFKIPVASTIIEVAVSANAGTPKTAIVQKNHWNGSAWTATDIMSAALTTGSAGIETCAATGAACVSGVAKDGTVTITTAGSANVVAAGDWIQTKTGSGFASGGAKRLSVCVTYTVN